MTLRPLVFAIAPIFAAATASTSFAQAPGEMAAEPAYAGPSSAAPVVANPYGNPYAINPMAKRWAIAVGMGSFVVAPEDAPEGSEAKFRNTEIALRYRMSRRLELELLLTGGRQFFEGDVEGDLANGGGMLGARYRFRPEHKWNWWLSGGLGVTVIAHHTSDETARDAAQRPMASLGIGIERRFRRFALQAELKSLAIGPRKDQTERGDTPVATPPMPEPDRPDGSGEEPKDPMPVPPLESYGEPEELKGASFTVNLSYYF